jgi:hypothetical protein
MAQPIKTKDIIDQLGISADLRKEFEEQAAIYAYWAFQCAKANELVRKYEERHDLLFSRFYAEYRDQHAGAKENDCKSHIRVQSEYVDCQDRLKKARYNADVYKAAAKAFEMRATMLTQLGAMTRVERETSTLTGSTVKKTREALSSKATRVGANLAGKRKGKSDEV